MIWRSVGQSVEGNERTAVPFRREGLERVAYSPKEQNIPGYSGHDALIRFYADPDEWCGWTGDASIVINFTQHLRQRDPYTNWTFWEQATQGLSRAALGPGSEVIAGPGAVGYDAPIPDATKFASVPSKQPQAGGIGWYDVTFPNTMKDWLRHARVYLYTGTQPASYTLGLIESMMTGIPVVSIGPSWMRIFPYGPDLFEGHEISERGFDNPTDARRVLELALTDRDWCAEVAVEQRARAIDLFGMDKIKAEWAAFLR